jgi:PAS domain S-box-containing protein
VAQFLHLECARRISRGIVPARDIHADLGGSAIESKPAERDATAVAKDDALFGALFGQSAVGIAVGSIEGRFLRANDALCRMLGYGEQELLEMSVRDITHADDLGSNLEFREEVLSGQAQSRVYEKRYLRKDGSPIWVQIVGTVVRDASGAPQCFVALVYDITELKFAQDALKASERRFRRMAELSSDWYWVQDENLRFVELPGLEKKRAIDPRSLIGKRRWELPGLEPLPEGVWQRHREKLERRESFEDFVYLARDDLGDLRYLSVSGEPVFDEQGRFKGYHGIGKDVTDKARALKAVEDSEARYRMLFNIHPQPMWVVEQESLRFLAVNQAAIDHYGYSREEFLSMTAEQLRYPEDLGQLLRDFQDQSRSYMQRAARHRKKNGEQIRVEIVSFNLEFDGSPARMAVITDVTERMRSEE